MPYRARNVPPDPKDIPRFLDQELRNLETAQNGPFAFVRLEVLHAAPAKTFDGLMVLADGTDWNPGSGGGVYCYRAGAWRFLG